MSNTFTPGLDNSPMKELPPELHGFGSSFLTEANKLLHLLLGLSQQEIGDSVNDKLSVFLIDKNLISSNDEIPESNDQIHKLIHLLQDAYLFIGKIWGELEHSNAELALVKRNFEHALSQLAMSQQTNGLEQTKLKKELGDLKEKVAGLNRVIAQQEIRLQDLLGEHNFAHNSKSPL